jgi:hypothetical protein
VEFKQSHCFGYFLSGVLNFSSTSDGRDEGARGKQLFLNQFSKKQ